MRMENLSQRIKCRMAKTRINKAKLKIVQPSRNKAYACSKYNLKKTQSENSRYDDVFL